MANIGDILTNPESGYQRISCLNLNVKYTGSWTYDAKNTYSLNVSDYVEFYFYGTKIELCNALHSSHSQNVTINLDGTEENFSQYQSSSTAQYYTLCYKKEGLEKKIHKVKIYSTETSAPRMSTIDIDEDGYMIYCDDNGKLYYDVTPIMTSNTTPAPYVASASSEYSTSFSAYKAFNGTNIDNYDCWSSSSVTNSYIILDFGNKTKATSFIIRGRNSSENIKSSPKDFLLFGSNEGASYNQIVSMENQISWTPNEERMFNLRGTYNYKYYKLQIDSSENSTSPPAIAELRFLLAVDAPFYLVEENGRYYNYNEENDSLEEVADTSILNVNALENTCIYDLNKVLHLIPNINNINLISNQNAKLTVNGIKSNKELIVSNENLSITSAETIKQYIPTVIKTGNGELYTVVSNNNGTTWKTWNVSNSAWEDLTNICPLDAYKDLTSEQFIKWNTFRDEVATKGINSTNITNANFELLRNSDKRLRFAFVFERPTYADNIVLKDLQWLIDKVGGWIKLDENDIKIKVTPTNCEVTALQDNMQNVKVNILI